MRRLPRVSITVALATCVALPLTGAASAQLSTRIDSTREQVEDKRYRESVLSQDISSYNGRIERLEGQISGLQQRQDRLQASLDAKLAELADIRARLERARERLAQLRSDLAFAEDALAERLVELYKADEPDALTVVLEADGFADLLERTEFMERVSDQDGRIIRRVREIKAAVTRRAEELEELEGRAEAAAAAIEANRDEIAAAKAGVERSRDELAQARGALDASLSRVRQSRIRLEGDLDELQAEQRQVQARLAAQQASQAAAPVPSSPAIPPLSAGDIRHGSGSLIWPVNGPLVSPFGMRWGRLHAGIDLAVPSGTPIRAAKSGRVALLGPTGGYGNYTCVDHGGGLSTCYAHLSSFATSGGASVKQGQVIGYVGCTGHCFGDHLHFETRVNGAPVDPMGYL